MSKQQEEIIAARDRRIMELTGYAKRLERERDGLAGLLRVRPAVLNHESPGVFRDKWEAWEDKVEVALGVR